MTFTGLVPSDLGFRSQTSSKIDRMRYGLVCVLVAAPLLMSSSSSWAEDVWDRAGTGEDGTVTGNQLLPGASQVHDMEATGGIADQDWYRISQDGYASYEVIVDGMTAGLAVPGDDLAVDLMLGPTIQASATNVQGFGLSGFARMLHFQNLTGFVTDDMQVRVSSPNCTTTCGPNQQYSIRFLDTTYSVPRYNNSATQLTLLILQNTSTFSVSFRALFFNSVGLYTGEYVGSLAGQASVVVNTNTVSGVAGTSGSILIVNNGRYGAMSGKAVSLEPATGFVFDTAMQSRAQ